MYRNHREAFAPKKGSKRPVEANLDNIINQAQIKMKEMILEKQEIDKQTNTLIGQENVLNENINFLKNEISNKKQTIASLNEKVKETNDTNFSLRDLLEIYYGRKTYAKYDKSALQWNKFVQDFCADPATERFPNKLKAAAKLWKIVRESTREKVYTHDLLNELNIL